MTTTGQDRLRLLLVDDNPDDRALARRELTQEFAQLEILEVTDRAQFLELVEHDRFDVLVTDYQLHWADGLEVLRTIRLRRPWCATVMFTGTGNEEIAVAAMHEGLDEYVVKSPQRFQRLPDAVRRALARVRDRRALQDAEAQTRLQAFLLEALDVGVVTTDAAERVIYCNPAASRLYGWRPEEAHGRDGFEALFPGVLRTEAAGLRATVAAGHPATTELALPKAGGGRRWLRVTARPISGPPGSFSGILGIVSDITTQRVAERALRESEERYRALAERSQAGIWHVTVDGRTVYLNAAMSRMLELDRPEDIGEMTYRQFFTPQSLDALSREHPTLAGVTAGCDVELVGRRGARRPVVISGAPIFGPDGAPSGVLQTVIDVSEHSADSDAHSARRAVT